MGEIWGRLIHAAFVFVVEMPVYICSHSPWWVAECQLEMLPPLVRALGLSVARYCLYDFSLLGVLAIFPF